MHPDDLDRPAIAVRREHALADPLKAGDSLSPSGPSLDPSAITPAPNDPLSLHEQDIASQCPNPYRPPNSRLRDLLSRDPLPSSLRFTLDKSLCTGEDSWSQVWQATARRGDEEVGPVVVKLLVEALFPTHWEQRWWQPAEEAVEAELVAYVSSPS
jgi:hypothetical protein